MKNKVLYLSNSIIPSQYANSVHVMKMCQAIANNGFDVELLCYTTTRSFSIDKIFEKYGITKKFKINALSLTKTRAMFYQKIFSIVRFLKKHKTDSIVYGRDVYSVYLASFLGFKVYYESHGLPASKLHKFAENLLLNNRNLVKIIVISDKLKQLYLESGINIDHDKILVLHDGADAIDTNTAKVNLGHGLHIGYVGSLYYHGRGIDLILEIAKSNMDFSFHLIGGKSSEVAYWNNRATNNVKFYGFLSNSKISKYLLSFDVVLMPYQDNLRLDGMNLNTISWMSPMKMFEYMSSNSAIVSSDFPVIREVLNDENSTLVEFNDVVAWSQAIRNLYEDPDLLNKISSNSYHDFFEKYTWDRRVQFLKLQ